MISHRGSVGQTSSHGLYEHHLMHIITHRIVQQYKRPFVMLCYSLVRHLEGTVDRLVRPPGL
jgi:hypothetical protein